MANFYGIIAGIIGVIGYVPYVRDILRQTTRPDRASWLVWALEYSVLFAAQLAKGAVSSLWLVGLQLFGVLIVFGLSFRYGVGSIDRRAIMLLGCVCLALGLWCFTKNASIALLISLAVEASGVILTAIKVFRQPGSETLSTWWLIGVAGIVGLFSVTRPASVILYVYPIALAVMSASVILAASLGALAANNPTPSIDSQAED